MLVSWRLKYLSKGKVKAEQKKKVSSFMYKYILDYLQLVFLEKIFWERESPALPKYMSVLELNILLFFYLVQESPGESN